MKRSKILAKAVILTEEEARALPSGTWEVNPGARTVTVRKDKDPDEDDLNVFGRSARARLLR